jgi:hypothetical protein
MLSQQFMRTQRVYPFLAAFHLVCPTLEMEQNGKGVATLPAICLGGFSAFVRQRAGSCPC